MTAPNPEYSIVVPVYQSGPQLRDLVERLAIVFDQVLNTSHEIILVDDGSTSPVTLALLPELAASPNVCVVRLTRNFGKPGAVLCGLAHSSGDWVVTIDDDLQQLPEDIPKLVVHRDHDMVTATHTRHHSGGAREITSRIKRFFDTHSLGYSVSLSALKVIRRPIVDGMLKISTNKPFIPALIREITTDVVAVETELQESAYPRSRYTFRARWVQFSSLLFGNSGFLLRCFVWLGGSLVALGLMLAIGLLSFMILGRDPGFDGGWLSALILFVGGANMMAVGTTGEYLIRIMAISSGKPAYVVRETLNE
ncbi:glycosyltransferase [Parasphingopyxis sp. CP4]|uniref:glycosyltransferase n=1 Tax=Parasphingopyxis sp. CP4 TaxID=2724527 RepID=UPI0015A2D588|nr:glycosyltransferase [Parasphingopyxis sp. CP4]QLC22265.1 glycosyltransferase [Parasphingopyxis sp. CP4]